MNYFSSHWAMKNSLVKAFPKNFANFTGKSLCGSLFFVKLQTVGNKVLMKLQNTVKHCIRWKSLSGTFRTLYILYDGCLLQKYLTNFSRIFLFSEFLTRFIFAKKLHGRCCIRRPLTLIPKRCTITKMRTIDGFLLLRYVSS